MCFNHNRTDQYGEDVNVDANINVNTLLHFLLAVETRVEAWYSSSLQFRSFLSRTSPVRRRSIFGGEYSSSFL